MIRLALNQNSCKNQKFFEFIKYAKDFKCVELNFREIKNFLSETIKLRNILENLEIYNLKVESIFSLKDISLSSERKYKTKILNRLKQMFKFCDGLESNLIVVNPSKLERYPNSNTIPKWRIANRTRKRLESMAKIANSEDIKIGLEFLSDSSISTLNEAIKVVEPLESIENLGFVIDSFHIAKSESDYSRLRDINDLIFLIQLSDIKHETSDSIIRVFPGEGDFEFREFLKFTQKIRYSGVYSIELAKEECLENLYQKFLRKFTTI